MIPALPKVSVLIPTYNQADMLDEAIRSVMDQTFTDFELIIVDNHSIDHTPEVVGRYMGDERVRFFRNEGTVPMAQNWNKCLDLSRGEYLKYLCSDDKFHPHLLEKMVPVLDQNPNVSIVSCQREWFGDRKRLFPLLFPGVQDGRETILNTLRNYNWLGEPSNVMLRRSNLGLGGFGKFTWITDWEMWVRHMMAGDYFGIPETLSYSRVHSGQVTHREARESIRHSEEYYHLYTGLRDGKFGLFSPEQRKELAALTRRKARVCARFMFSQLRRLHRPENRRVAMAMWRIAAREGVINLSVADTLKRHYNKVLGKKHLNHQPISG